MTIRTLRILADTDRCCGAGMCALTAPDVFDQDDIGLVRVLDAEPPPGRHAEVAEAVRLCPSGAISLAQDG